MLGEGTAAGGKTAGKPNGKGKLKSSNNKWRDGCEPSATSRQVAETTRRRRLEGSSDQKEGAKKQPDNQREPRASVISACRYLARLPI